MSDDAAEQRRAAARERLSAAAAKPWTDLLAEALQARENWDHASADLAEADAPAGPRAGEWSPWHVLNHVGGFFAGAAATLEGLIREGHAPEGANRDQWQRDGRTFAEVRSGAIQGWDRFIAAVIEAAAADPGATMEIPHFATLNARQWTALSIGHGLEHARQMRSLRGLAPEENPGKATDLGTRRQTAH